MQKHTEVNNNEEGYLIRHLGKKLSERYVVEGSKVQLRQRAGLPKIILLQEETNSIVIDTIFDSSIRVAAKIVKESLRVYQQTELTEGTDRFYPYLNELNLEKLTVEVTAPFKTFIERAAEKKKELRKIAVAHALMLFCKNE